MDAEPVHQLHGNEAVIDKVAACVIAGGVFFLLSRSALRRRGVEL